jgi:histone H3/H4
MAKAKKGKSGGSSKPAEMFLVASKVKGVIKSEGFNTAGDALDGLNDLVNQYILRATRRAKANGRKTVRNHDFHL